MAKLKFAFVIGRFQPFHNGHKHLIEYGLEHAERVIVLVGGSNKARSIKNPWTFEEREEMIESVFADTIDYAGAQGRVKYNRVIVEPLPDVPGNDDAWLGNVYNAVTKYSGSSQIGIIGFKKDESSYYLDLFPKAKKLILEEGFATLSATNLRDHFFQDAPVFPERLSPAPVVDYLANFYSTPHFKYVLDEKKFMVDYHKIWGKGPFITCDAVCTQMGHILLVTRGNYPGLGQLALPGGFVTGDNGDSFENVLHKLWGKTSITDSRGRIPRGKLRGFYTGKERRFDDPDRSVRGFTLTTAFRFQFPNAQELFTVAGGEEAADAQWYPIDYIKNNPQLLFEDHHHIMSTMKVW